LQPDLAPGLFRADLIVEAHDDRRPGITETLVRRFLPTHRIEIRYHCEGRQRISDIIGDPG
jgi:hypothetical protein